VPACNIVGAQHKHDYIRGRLLQPVGQVVVGDVDGEPSGVPFVVLVPVGRLRRASLRVAVLRPDVLDPIRIFGVCDLVPNEGTPATELD